MNLNQEGIYQNLYEQMIKIYKHNRQGSFKTKERYYEAMNRFLIYLANEWKLEKLSNIAPKHFQAYADHLQNQGKSPSTIKTELSAIRFFHDKISEPRYQLPDNRALSLEQRKVTGIDRTWKKEEFDAMIQLTEDFRHKDYIALFYLARYAGLRLEECLKIDTASAEKSIKPGD